MSQQRVTRYRHALREILGRALTARDGVSERRLREAESRLGAALPSAIRDYYLLAGAAGENREHNLLFTPEELVIEDGRLVFMEENQAVVHWGVPLKRRRRANPDVWQRVNADQRAWYPERKTFSVFIVKNLAGQRGVELSNEERPRTKPARAEKVRR